MGEAVRGVNPERFGRYVLLDKLGEGGMAEVYRAIMPGAKGFKRTFVVKKILSRFCQSAEFTEMFVQEAQISSLLHHPNIVQVYDFGNVDGHYFLAMEYLRGRDVLALIRRQIDLKRPISIPVATFIAHEVARGLAYAHDLTDSNGQPLDLIHRDVSPSNIMCLREGGVKLLDFGIAKTVTEFIPEQTDQKSFKGKLTYMAPERLRNDPLDGRSDLYSLGVVLWEMLTCKRLFQGVNEVERLKNVLEMRVLPPSAIRPGLPAKLDAIVLRALERDRTKRYATGVAMADDLEEILRETNYQTRMLPSLLIESFGSGTHSSQVVMSSLTPEFLEAMTPSDVPASRPGFQSFIRSFVQQRFASRASRWTIVGIGVMTALLLVWGLVTGKERSSQTDLNPSRFSTEHPIPRVVPLEPTNLLPISTTPTVASPEDGADSAMRVAANPTSEKFKRKLIGKKNTQSRKPTITNPIGDGLSIDPFYEAESRRRR